jgi:UDP-GlcNAc3NAcA epimerase
MKILTVVGARPQFIKAAVVSREFLKDKFFNEVIVHTGQHFDANMSEIFFKELEIPAPKYNMAVHSIGNSEMVSEMLKGLDDLIKKESPDLVLVYGDTNSTLAGAIAAKQNKIALAHVEAGMRSRNMKMAEELNRVITDRISDILFCSTEAAINNLVTEGFENLNCEIFLTGDVMYDAALYYSEKSDSDSGIIQRLELSDYVLATVHRAENVDDANALKGIVKALNEISKKIRVILPFHPRTKRQLEKAGLVTGFSTIEPVGYLDMIQLIKNSRLVMTDSGGLQKEAFFFKKNCITLRNESEWTELVEHGFNALAGSKASKIMAAFEKMTKENYVFNLPLYGDGHAAKKIAAYLKKKL